jgi:hypothetical protein
MKTLWVLATVLSLSLPAGASTITLVSSAATTTNSSANPTLNIDPNPLWAPALTGSSWISNAITGNPNDTGFVVEPNGTTVTFSESFNLNAPVIGASLSILADDTTSVVLNGTTVFTAANPPTFPLCSPQPIGCLTTTEATLSFAQLDPYFKLGNNTLSFGVVQRNGVSFGLDYAGTVTTMPEPGSLALIGTGLVAFALFLRHQRAR